MWGMRVVIPPPGQVVILHELHEGHPGISKTKVLARMYVWWPGMNCYIEKSVRRCGVCQQVDVTGLDDKHEMNALLPCTLSGSLLPPRLIYAVKTFS